MEKTAEEILKLKQWVDDNYPNFNKADLEAKIDELSKQPASDGWVSVEDRLPTEQDADENGKVLIYRNTNAGQKGLSKSIFDYFMLKNCDKDTHWQPLPSPPKP